VSGTSVKDRRFASDPDANRGGLTPWYSCGMNILILRTRVNDVGELMAWPYHGVTEKVADADVVIGLHSDGQARILKDRDGDTTIKVGL
jgi:hypothetical protein